MTGLDLKYDTLRVTVQDRTALVTLDRPQALNAFNGQMFDDLCEVFLAAGSDPGVSVLILTGAGKAFSAGADLKEMMVGQPPTRHGLTGLLDAIIDFPKPFLLAINGVGVGIGCTIAGLADFTLMADTARLRCPFSELGLSAEVASTVTFPRAMGHQRAMWFLWSGEWWNAQQCVDAGLAVQAVPADELIGRITERAATLAALPVASLVATKELVMAPQREQLKAAYAAENRSLAQLVGGPANTEAVAAFIEKRPPDFTNLH